MIKGKLVLYVEYDPDQITLPNIVKAVEYSSVADALVTIADSVGDGEAVSFGCFEAQVIDRVRAVVAGYLYQRDQVDLGESADVALCDLAEMLEVEMPGGDGGPRGGCC